MSKLYTVIILMLVSVFANAGGFGRLGIQLEVAGSYHTGVFDEGAAEVVAYDRYSGRVFVVNANDASIDVLDISNPDVPEKVASISAAELGASANSVAVHGGLVAVAIEAENKQDNGVVAFYSSFTLELLSVIDAGALPDMVAFSPNGRYVLVANEGEPNDDYDIDPEGSVTIIDIKKGIKNAVVKQVGFDKFNDKKDELIAAGVRIFGPNATVAQDLEPEYITVDKRSRTAFVALQENNAIARINLRKAEVEKIMPLGFKDHSVEGNELDVSNKDKEINIKSWPVYGMYQPDSIASYSFRGKTYIVTANEGDSRDYDGFGEEERVADVELDAEVFPNAEELQDKKKLGRIKITTSMGDIDGDGDFDRLYTYGGRSFSIFDEDGKLVYDSGSDFARIVAEQIPEYFNSNNDSNDSFDSRSDDKGIEPEGLAVGKIFGSTYAFIGLERMGGIMVYDITNPARPEFLQYLNNRDFSEPACLLMDDDEECITGAGSANPAAGDLAPEGITFVPWHQSPTWEPLLIVGNEVSGSTTVYRIKLAFKWEK